MEIKWKCNCDKYRFIIITAGLLNAGMNTLSVQVLTTTLLTRADLHPVKSYLYYLNIDTLPICATITAAGGAITFCNSGSVT